MNAAWGLSDEHLSDQLCRVFAQEQVLAARRLILVHEADARGLPSRDGATSTVAWLRDRLRVSPHAARRMLELARALDRTASLTAEALAAGVVNVEQAEVIARAVTELSAVVTADVQDKAEQRLIGDAATFEPQSLAKLATRILDHVAPELAEEQLRRQLEAQQARAEADRNLALTPDGTGRVRLTGWLETDAAAVVSAALDPLCAPGRNLPATPATVTAGSTGADGSAGTAGSAGSLSSAGQGDLATLLDPRSPGQRRADALVEVCRLVLATGELPDNGGDRAQIVVTIGYEHLVARVGAGTLDNGQFLSPETVRRLACDAAILPAVLNGQGQVLDLGRERRLFTGPIRRALVLRDQGCAFPGCDRPPRWCDGHHIRHWSDGGPTNLAKAVNR